MPSDPTISMLDEIEAKAKAATPGPWTPSRPDCQSYDGQTGVAFAHVYWRDPDGEWHLGQRVPGVVARCEEGGGKADANHIARCDPATIIALVRVARAAHALAIDDCKCCQPCPHPCHDRHYEALDSALVALLLGASDADA